MTTYDQPPVMTDAHITAMRSVCSLWPYSGVVNAALLRDILHHLEALLLAPVAAKSADPIRYNGEHQQGQNTGSAFDDWRLEYRPLAEPYESDQ